jgi:hypothetical protein
MLVACNSATSSLQDQGTSPPVPCRLRGNLEILYLEVKDWHHYSGVGCMLAGTMTDDGFKDDASPAFFCNSAARHARDS